MAAKRFSSLPIPIGETEAGEEGELKRDETEGAFFSFPRGRFSPPWGRERGFLYSAPLSASKNDGKMNNIADNPRKSGS